MKAKTAVSTLLALALSATVCAGLAGCGEEKNGDKNNGGTQTQEPAVDNSKYTVTKAEWENAFDFSDKNCTVKVAWDIEPQDSMIFYFVDSISESEKAGISEELSEGYSFYASKAYDFFAFDEATKSYKSTGSWYVYLAGVMGWGEEGEQVVDMAEYVGEVKFEDKKLVSCKITLNAGEENGAMVRGTYTTTVTDYGVTVKPADAGTEE